MIPAKGVMEFDTADLLQMEHEGTLLDVITHEMGHVLGIGSIWDRLGLLANAGTANPTFTGPNAIWEFNALLGATGSQQVPVENTGGPGTGLFILGLLTTAVRRATTGDSIAGAVR